ncbi:hypothetical protein AVEN_225046-1, partial [Araneus ventricosus]
GSLSPSPKAGRTPVFWGVVALAARNEGYYVTTTVPDYPLRRPVFQLFARMLRQGGMMFLWSIDAIIPMIIPIKILLAKKKPLNFTPKLY